MYDRELAKRMLNFLILDILKEYSDEDHRLTQQEILRLLKLNYDVECDRRSVKSNVEALKAFGYEIDMEDGYCLLERDFEESELRMLIDSVLFSKNISQSVAQTLINRLKEQGNRYFRAKVPYIYSLPEMRYADNTQVMYNLDVLNTAIAEKKAYIKNKGLLSQNSKPFLLIALFISFFFCILPFWLYPSGLFLFLWLLFLPTYH